jgi:hypothetical protein
MASMHPPTYHCRSSPEITANAHVRLASASGLFEPPCAAHSPPRHGRRQLSVAAVTLAGPP